MIKTDTEIHTSLCEPLLPEGEGPIKISKPASADTRIQDKRIKTRMMCSSDDSGDAANNHSSFEFIHANVSRFQTPPDLSAYVALQTEATTF